MRIALSVFAGAVAGAATAVSVILVGAAIFWMFIYGDDSWPRAAETGLVVIAYGAGAVAAVGVTIALWPRHRR